MKKRFLDRFTYPYLQERVPENIVPGRRLSSKRIRSLSKGKPSRVSLTSTPPIGGSTSYRSPGLCLRLIKSTLRLHKSKLLGEKAPWVRIDSLERGSLANDTTLPSLTEVGFSATQMGVGAPKGHSVAGGLRSARVWLGRVPTGKAPGLSRGGARDVAPAPSLGRTPPSRRGDDSLYSSFQLEEAASKQQERRPSPLFLKLMERRKLRIIYGNMANREVGRLIKRGLSTRGGMSDNLFRLLESRLDVFLCRIGFLASIPSARQWIQHGKVLINCKTASTASHMLKTGDVVSISRSNLAPLRESLQERSRKLQILRYGQAVTWAASSKLPRFRGSSQERGRGTTLPPHFSGLIMGPRLSLDRPIKAPQAAQRERLRCFNLKPLHAEISFRCLTAIYLYPPQQILLPATVDVEKIKAS